jgi:hypothetical protein
LQTDSKEIFADRQLRNFRRHTEKVRGASPPPHREHCWSPIYLTISQSVSQLEMALSISIMCSGSEAIIVESATPIAYRFAGI